MTVDDVSATVTSPTSYGDARPRQPYFLWLVVATVFTFAAYGLVAPALRQNIAPSARSAAPDFAASAFTGEAVQLAKFRGRPVVVNFWASWCAPCRAEAQDLERVWQTYRDRGVVFLGVDIQDTETEARTFLHELGISYLNVRDANSDVARAYEVSGIPATFFIDRDGQVANRWSGPITQQQLVARLEELLK